MDLASYLTPTRSTTTWPRPRATAHVAQALAPWEDPAAASGTLRADPDLPSVFTAASVGGELAFAALLLDGVLDLERPGVAVHSNEPSTRLLRALACVVDPGLDAVVGRSAAAWVHTGRHAPATVNLFYTINRTRPTVHLPADVTRTIFLPGEIQAFGPVRVTSPLRTVMDLATWRPEQARRHIPTFTDAPALIRAALAHIEGTPNFRHKKVAIPVLEALLTAGDPVHVEHALDSAHGVEDSG